MVHQVLTQHISLFHGIKKLLRTNIFICRHDTFNQCWFSVMPASRTLIQYWANVVCQLECPQLASKGHWLAGAMLGQHFFYICNTLLPTELYIDG